MSITSARNFFEKSGCGTIVAIGLVVVMALGVASQCNLGSRASDANNPQPGANAAADVVAKAGGYTVSAQAISEAYDKNIAMMDQNGRAQAGAFGVYEGIPASVRAETYMNTVAELIDGAVNLNLAQKGGVVLTTDQIVSTLSADLKTQIDQVRAQMQQEGKLKAGATDAEFETAFKAQFGQSTADIMASKANEVKALLATEPGKLALGGRASYLALVDKNAKAMNIPKEELDKMFYSVKLKSILLKEAIGQDRMAEAQKVYDEIKSGKITFEAAMDKYSDNPAEKGKAKRDKVDILAYQFLLIDKDYGPVKDLKPGQMSNVIKGADGPIIYKYIEETDGKPADFNSRVEFYKESHAKFKANVAYNKDLEAARQEVEFPHPGFGSIFILKSQFARLKVQPDQLLKAYQSGKAAIGIDSQAGAIGAYIAGLRLQKLLPGKPGTPSAQELAEAGARYADMFDGPAIRLEMVTQFVKLKSKEAGNQLLKAAQSNSTYGPQGLDFNKKIFAQLDELKKAGLIEPATVKEIEAVQAKWLADKKADDEARKKAATEAQAAEAKAQADAKAAEKAAAAKQNAGPSSGDLSRSAPPVKTGN
ncbi:MAG: hypothetical protein J0L72_00655 [Armatimonadetes bacterium]|nr:hypothetical protein [Armatimonadota bacterium]